MIEHKQGNILHEEAEALVNTVNCVGVMGRGIALQFKKAFPENFRAYAKACKNDEIKPGKLFVFKIEGLIQPRYIINFPTKRHWRDKSRLEDIRAGLQELVKVINHYQIHSIAIPPLGSGLGGLAWPTVKPIIETALQPLSHVHTVIYNPCAVTDRVVPTAFSAMTPGKAVLVGLINQYLLGWLNPIITLLEVHKLLYFMQMAGEPLKLRYEKASYGPYAENLRHVLKKIEGYWIKGYTDGGDNPYKPLELMPGASEAATHFLQQCPETKNRFDRVSRLVEGFESTSSLELLATVHWVMMHDKPQNFEQLVGHIYSWNPRKRRFTSREIKIAADRLAKQGWITQLHAEASMGEL